MYEYDALIVVTAREYRRVQNQYYKLVEHLPAHRIFFTGDKEAELLVRYSGLGEKVCFIDENEILSFEAVHEVMTKVLEDVLQGQTLPGEITGWYYQQFLKMQYAYLCRDKYYLIWDGDTIPCTKFSMFHEEGKLPYLDLKCESNEKYFITISKLFPGISKCIEKSFVSEHMLINCDIMQQLICDIEKNADIPGGAFWEKIIYAIGEKGLQENRFSEFETYGTYAIMHYPGSYRLRDWKSFRYGGRFFSLDTISDEDYAWLSKDFSAISFKKGDSVREEQKNLFNNKKYQEKLTAGQMLDIVQNFVK